MTYQELLPIFVQKDILHCLLYEHPFFEVFQEPRGCGKSRLPPPLLMRHWCLWQGCTKLYLLPTLVASGKVYCPPLEVHNIFVNALKHFVEPCYNLYMVFSELLIAILQLLKDREERGGNKWRVMEAGCV